MEARRNPAGRFESMEQREQRAQRAQDPSWSALQTFSAPSGTGVTARAAENLSTVLACVSAIATALASLPAFVYRQVERGRMVERDHPLAALIRHGVNQHQTWPDFIEWTASSVLLRGNALAELITDTTGNVVGMTPIPWDRVSVQLLPSGRLAYDLVEQVGVHGATGRVRRLLTGEVLHLRDRSDDGIVGRSRLQRAGAVLTAAASIQEFSGAMFRNGVNPSGALEVDGILAGEARERLNESFRKAFVGPSNAAKALILESGIKWKQISVSPEDAELLASRRFTTEELARIFGCPPPIIGDLSHGTFTNSETAGRWFAQHTLTPWVRKIETEFGRTVFAAHERDTHGLELDLTGLMRGDHAARWQGYGLAVENQILTPNEVREVEGWNPREGGDDFAQEAPAQ